MTYISWPDGKGTAHVLAESGVALCGKPVNSRVTDHYYVADPKVILHVHNACEKCRDHPDFGLLLLGEL